MAGPYIRGAFFCEQVIEGKDNILSFIRVVDQVITTAEGPNTPQDMPKLSHPLVLVLMLVAGDARGRHDVRIDMREPSGMVKRPGPTVTVQFDNSLAIHNVVFRTVIELESEGPHWFEVYLDSATDPLTRIPLQVKYQRIQHPSP